MSTLGYAGSCCTGRRTGSLLAVPKGTCSHQEVLWDGRVCRELADTCLALNTWGLVVTRRGLSHCSFDLNSQSQEHKQKTSQSSHCGCRSHCNSGTEQAAPSWDGKCRQLQLEDTQTFLKGWSLHSLPKSLCLP